MLRISLFLTNLLPKGILSLLRRGVSKIISFCANNEELQDLSPDSDPMSGADGIRQQWDRSVDANEVSHIADLWHFLFDPFLWRLFFCFPNFFV
jgi:hypothetical protein